MLSDTCSAECVTHESPHWRKWKNHWVGVNGLRKLSWFDSGSKKKRKKKAVLKPTLHSAERGFVASSSFCVPLTDTVNPVLDCYLSLSLLWQQKRTWRGAGGAVGSEEGGGGCRCCYEDTLIAAVHRYPVLFFNLRGRCLCLALGHAKAKPVRLVPSTTRSAKAKLGEGKLQRRTDGAII